MSNQANTGKKVINTRALRSNPKRIKKKQRKNSRFESESESEVESESESGSESSSHSQDIPVQQVSRRNKKGEYREINQEDISSQDDLLRAELVKLLSNLILIYRRFRGKSERSNTLKCRLETIM